MPSQQWQTLKLPTGAKPVHNKVGLFIVLSAEQKKQYKDWKLFQRHDGQFWLYFGAGIKRALNDVAPDHQVLTLKY